MISSPIFRKLFWSAVSITLLTLLALDFYLTRYIAQEQLRAVQQRLSGQARILAGELAGRPVETLAPWADNAASRAEARITLIAPGGAVLADSERSPQGMENHAGRPEVFAARKGGVGTDIRRSETTGFDQYYVAIPAPLAQNPGAVLRLSVPLKQLDSAIAAVRWRILAASLLAATLALAVAYVGSHRFSRRIRRLQKFAEGLLEARFTERPLPDAEDELGALASSLNDMASQTHELVDKLRLESARRQAILTSMAEGVLVVDRDLRVTFYNDSLLAAFDIPAPAEDRPPLTSFARDHRLVEMLTRVLVTGAPSRQRLTLPEKSRSFEVNAAPLAAAPGRGAVAILHDVTEIERLERVRQDFVANVSHELRTPLASIQGYAETLLDGAIEDSQHNRKFLEIIRAQTIRLNNIASDLLTLSELDSGPPAASPESVSLIAVAEAALTVVESEARARCVRLTRGEMHEATVMGGRSRLEQAVVNLLVNAIRFNKPDGEVTISVLRSSKHAKLTVADTGAGIPSEDLPRIFERFYRVDRARSREMGGTGLGLSIVKHIVERAGGTVQVQSRLGVGSIFTLTLPVA